MAIDFPNSPTVGQIYTVGDKSWIWDGTVWKAYGASLSPTVLKVDSTNTRVGINNQSPAYTLDVNGTVEATQFIQGSDYLTPYAGFRNAIINGDFRINQRVFSSTTTNNDYGFDRWRMVQSSGTNTYSTQTFTVGSPAATGYESATYARLVTGSQGTSSTAETRLVQQIEDVRTFANSTVTVSFWAQAGSGTPKMAVEVQQDFGSGGSPSTPAVSTAFGSVTLSTTWTRYTLTAALPNINGKTIGTTANTSSLILSLWCSAGSSYATRASSIGIQSSTTFNIWGVQVERGSVATPFEQRPIQTELALCQRYYEKSYRMADAPGTVTNNGIWQIYGSVDLFLGIISTVTFSVPKRYTSYTMTGYVASTGASGSWFYQYNGGLNTGTSAIAFDLVSERQFRANHQVTGGSAGGTGISQGHWVCNAEF